MSGPQHNHKFFKEIAVAKKSHPVLSEENDSCIKVIAGKQLTHEILEQQSFSFLKENAKGPQDDLVHFKRILRHQSL